MAFGLTSKTITGGKKAQQARELNLPHSPDDLNASTLNEWRCAQHPVTPDHEGNPMSEHEELYPQATAALAEQRSRLAPGPAEAFRAFSRSVFAEGELSVLTKQLIAVAVAHVTQCPYCIRSHTKTALRDGATPRAIMEAIWVAAEMRAGGAYAHSALALDTISHYQAEHATGLGESTTARSGSAKASEGNVQ
jgi:AhpD family alkylhydroperoxidase